MKTDVDDLVPVLDALVDRCVEAVKQNPVLSSLLAGTATPEELRLFAARTGEYVRETVPALVRAADRLVATGGDAEVCAFLRRKIEEESGHDEWIAGDLAACQGALGAAPLPAPSAAVRGYIEINRALIDTVTPVAYLGAAYVLERLAADLAAEAVERLTQSGAASPDALVFLRGHASADPHHVAEAAAVLRRIEDPVAIEAILLSAQCTSLLYPAFFTAAA